MVRGVIVWMNFWVWGVNLNLPENVNANVFFVDTQGHGHRVPTLKCFAVNGIGRFCLKVQTKKSRRDDMIIAKGRNTISNPVGVKYYGNNGNTPLLRG